MTHGKEIEINGSSIITAKPDIVLQEETDNWGILYNPDTDYSFGINPVSVYIWKQIKSKTTLEEIISRVKENCENVPGEVEEDVIQFSKKLLEKELAVLNKA